MSNSNTIALAIRPKNGYLYRYMEENHITAKRLAERIGISDSTLGKIMHFGWIPSDNKQARKTAEKICAFFQCELEDVFSKELIDAIKNNKKIARILQNKQTLYKQEVELEFLADYTQFQALPGPDDFANVDDKLAIDKVLNTLSPREQRILRQRYFENQTYAEIGITEKVSSNRVRQLEYTALRRLRHPCRSALFEGMREQW